jgi:hypothetical protein
MLNIGGDKAYIFPQPHYWGDASPVPPGSAPMMTLYLQYIGRERKEGTRIAGIKLDLETSKSLEKFKTVLVR